MEKYVYTIYTNLTTLKKVEAESLDEAMKLFGDHYEGKINCFYPAQVAIISGEYGEYAVKWELKK